MLAMRGGERGVGAGKATGQTVKKSEENRLLFVFFAFVVFAFSEQK